jgi:hypothetical protein
VFSRRRAPGFGRRCCWRSAVVHAVKRTSQTPPLPARGLRPPARAKGVLSQYRKRPKRRRNASIACTSGSLADRSRRARLVRSWIAQSGQVPERNHAKESVSSAKSRQADLAAQRDRAKVGSPRSAVLARVATRIVRRQPKYAANRRDEACGSFRHPPTIAV